MYTRHLLKMGGECRFCSKGGTMVAIMLSLLMFSGSVQAQFETFQKISDTQGGFKGKMDDGDDLGESVVSLGDIDGDGVPDLAVSAEDDDDGGTNRGAVWIMFLNRDGTVKSHQKISDTQGGFTGRLDDNDEFGNWVADLGDVNGDGVIDIAVNAIGDDDGGSNRGAIWILFLNPDGTVKSHQKISDTKGGFTPRIPNGYKFGRSLGGLGDFDFDGVPDLITGNQGDDDGGKNRGAVWLLFLNSDGTVKSYRKISATQGGFTGKLTEDNQFGQSVESIGDFDGDGVTDIAVGAERDDDGGLDKGAVWLLFLNPDGTVKSHQKISQTKGNLNGKLQSGGDFGQSVASLGDLDGDGVTDLAVGAEFESRRGATWILYLNPDGTVKSHQKISYTSSGFSGQLDRGDEFGQDIANLGDIDGDGVIDFAVTADADDDGGPHRGALYIFFPDFQPPPGGGNVPPVLSPIGDRTVLIGELLEFTVIAQDADDSSLVLTTSALPPGATFSDNGNGTGTFGWQPGSGVAPGKYDVTFIVTDPDGASDRETITITVVDGTGGGAFLQDAGSAGIVSMEAENFHRNIARGGHSWVLKAKSAASGGAAMRAVPDNRTNIKTGYVNKSPQLDYDIEFVKTGKHYVWVLGMGPHSGSDSLHAGLDGVAVSSAANIKGFNPDKQWVWENRFSSASRITINIPSAGPHTLNLWMREDGFFADKIVLTTDPTFVPKGFGPAESPR